MVMEKYRLIDTGVPATDPGRKLFVDEKGIAYDLEPNFEYRFFPENSVQIVRLPIAIFFMPFRAIVEVLRIIFRHKLS